LPTCAGNIATYSFADVDAKDARKRHALAHPCAGTIWKSGEAENGEAAHIGRRDDHALDR